MCVVCVLWCMTVASVPCRVLAPAVVLRTLHLPMAVCAYGATTDWLGSSSGNVGVALVRGSIMQ